MTNGTGDKTRSNENVDKKSSGQPTRTSGSNDFGGALLGLVVIGLAGYGLLKLLS
jgi:hypothetical protein